MDTVTLNRGLVCGPDFPVNSYSGGLRRCAAAHSCSADLGCFGAGCWLSTRLAHAVRMKALAASMPRSEEHTSELQSLMRTSYAVFCLKKKNKIDRTQLQDR